jgi:hypothetical protein
MRQTMFALVSRAELAIVALARVLDMVIKAQKLLGTKVPVPSVITRKHPSVVAIRNAYEHIEDRALGHVHAKPHADALTIFEQADLVASACINYGAHTLELDNDVTRLIAEARAFFKSTVAST